MVFGEQNRSHQSGSEDRAIDPGEGNVQEHGIGFHLTKGLGKNWSLEQEAEKRFCPVDQGMRWNTEEAFCDRE